MIADWYFDFVSPFAYLQSERLAVARAARLRSATGRCCSPALLDANGQKGPAEIAAKRAFTYRFVVWQARRLGIPLKFPHEHPFNPLPLLRLAIACDCTPDAVHRIFRFVWRDGRLPDLPIEWAELAHDLGVPDADARIADRRGEGRAAPQHRRGDRARRVRRADARDRRRAVLGRRRDRDGARLRAAGCRFDDPEYARVASLPVGARATPAAKPSRSDARRSSARRARS